MVNNLTQTSAALAIGAILLFATTGQYAFGDNLRNDIVVHAVDTSVPPGGTVTVDYFVQITGAGDGGGGAVCDPTTDGNPTFGFSISPVSPAVGKSPTQITFSACDNNGTTSLEGAKTVVFTVPMTATPGNTYTVTPTVVNANGGIYNVGPAVFIITVETPPDTTGPVISKTITGTLGDNDWYTSDVALDWTVSDPESAVVIDSGCADTTISADTSGVTLDCFAHSAGGSSSDSITIKRDATAPIISGNAAPAPNGAGWNNGDVTVTFTCSDAMSDISSCTADASVGEGASQSVDGTAVDNAGNSAMTTLSDINVDKTDPSISGDVSPTANVNGWHNSDVTVTFTCSDGLSGLESCTSPVTLTAEGAGQMATGDAIDKADNSASASVENINIDKTLPIITGSRTPSTNAEGWNNVPVDVDFECSDSLAGIESCGPDVTLNGEGSGQFATGTAVDFAGNSDTATVSDINIDMTGPSIIGSRTPIANSFGWNNGQVDVHFDCSDSLSGIASCTPDVALTIEGAGQSVTGNALDKADNGNSATVENINIDITAPTISGSRTPAANIHGWNNEPVTVEFDCSDTLSMIDTCTADVVLDGEAAGQSVIGTAVDRAGNSAISTVGDINIDLTAPTNVAFMDGSIDDGDQYYFGFVPAGPTMCSADDALSGFDYCTVTGGGSTVGSHSYTAMAYDKAGNHATATISYIVNPWTIHGFYQPVDMGANVYNAVKGGSTVPLKFEVYAGATELTDTWVKNYLSAKKANCIGGAVIDDIEEYTSTGQTIFRYDAEGGQFIDNWKVPSVAKGTCYEVKLLTIDGTSIAALFKIK